MRILLIGDASNYHATLAIGLRALGHNVTVASGGSGWMKTERDIDLSRKPGKISGALLWSRINTLKWSRFTGYDVVSVATPNFLDLRPERIIRFFHFLKHHNKSVFLTALGTDIPFLDMCIADDCPLRYSEWKTGGSPAPLLMNDPETISRWHNEPLKRLHDAVYRQIDGAVSALYEYDLSIKRLLPSCKTAYGGIPIDTTSITPIGIPEKLDKIRFFIGIQRGRELVKGTDRILTAAKKIVAAYPDKVTLEVVENLPYRQYVERMRMSHVVLDQLYSYTPATNALLAMASGLVTFSGNEPEYYDFIKERELRPIIGSAPDDEMIFNALEDIVINPSKLHELGSNGRKLVERHNACDVVAKRFIDFWEKRLEEKYYSDFAKCICRKPQ